jgi:TonB family protein
MAHASPVTRHRDAFMRMPWIFLCALVLAALALSAADGIAALPSSSDDTQSPAQYASGTSGAGAVVILLDFNIPAQPLTDALNRYADVSNQPALFPSDIVGERTSSAIHGRYSPETALHLILEGTGLVAEKRDSGLGATFVLKQADVAVAAAHARLADLFNQEGYPGLVQQRIWQALCADALTAPGHYSSVLRFQVDAGGRVNGAQLLGSSGDARRDAALLATLQQVQIGSPPPAAIVQHSLAMAILPDQPNQPRCRAGNNKGEP